MYIILLDIYYIIRYRYKLYYQIYIIRYILFYIIMNIFNQIKFIDRLFLNYLFIMFVKLMNKLLRKFFLSYL